MGSLKENLWHFAKVALALLVINQIKPLREIINRDYFAGS